jgi:uncharacterized protein
LQNQKCVVLAGIEGRIALRDEPPGGWKKVRERAQKRAKTLAASAARKQEFGNVSSMFDGDLYGSDRRRRPAGVVQAASSWRKEEHRSAERDLSGVGRGGGLAGRSTAGPGASPAAFLKSDAQIGPRITRLNAVRVCNQPNEREETTMGNPFVHVELNTNDVNKAKLFYSKLFDWKLEDLDTPGDGYTLIKVGDGVGGGMMKQPVPGAPSNWVAYVGVDDIRAATQKAKSLGAKILMDSHEIPGMGWFSTIVDPTGATLNLWKPMAK